MVSILITALRTSLVTLALCGLLYPLVLTGVAQVLLPFQANGSLERNANGTVIGSRLIGQQWNGSEWFHGRPSATPDAPYNAANSGASNLGPDSRELAARLMADRKALEAAQPELVGRKLPADMLTASASGLDPDISPANAHLQAVRVARARHVPIDKIDALVDRYVTGRDLGIFGEPRVNVMELNRALARD